MLNYHVKRVSFMLSSVCWGLLFILGWQQCTSVLPVCTRTNRGVKPNIPLIPQSWSAPVFRKRFVTVSQDGLCSCRTLAAAERSRTVADSSCARYRCIYSFTRRLCHTVKVWNVPESPAGTQTNETFISVNPSLLSHCSAFFILRIGVMSVFGCVLDYPNHFF